ncbi:hypothetical protein WK24_06550 [Burkholderia vietnamiensis]|nr:hypothetical protein WK24_06550 [Burkholderia vietnamiensis]
MVAIQLDGSKVRGLAFGASDVCAVFGGQVVADSCGVLGTRREGAGVRGAVLGIAVADCLNDLCTICMAQGRWIIERQHLSVAVHNRPPFVICCDESAVVQLNDVRDIVSVCINTDRTGVMDAACAATVEHVGRVAVAVNEERHGLVFLVGWIGCGGWSQGAATALLSGSNGFGCVK